MRGLAIDLNKPVSEKTVHISCQTAASCTETSFFFSETARGERELIISSLHVFWQLLKKSKLIWEFTEPFALVHMNASSFED